VGTLLGVFDRNVVELNEEGTFEGAKEDAIVGLEGMSVVGVLLDVGLLEGIKEGALVGFVVGADVGLEVLTIYTGSSPVGRL
jgi:hypothetical protein